MEPNAEQAELLRQHGAKSFDELPMTAGMARLEYANLGSVTTDEVKADTTESLDVGLTLAQQQYLAAGPITTELERLIFEGLGGKRRELDLPPGDTNPTPVGGSSGGMPRLDTARLAGLTPTHRAMLADYLDTIITDRREAMRGIQPELRSSRADIDAARQHCGPYLAE